MTNPNNSVRDGDPEERALNWLQERCVHWHGEHPNDVSTFGVDEMVEAYMAGLEAALAQPVHGEPVGWVFEEKKEGNTWEKSFSFDNPNDCPERNEGPYQQVSNIHPLYAHPPTEAPTPDGEGDLARQIERLSSAATPAPFYTLGQPWLGGGVETSILAESPDPHVARYICDFDFAGMLDEDDRKSECPDADAELLVFLRNHVPQIITALSAKRDDGLRELLERCKLFADNASRMDFKEDRAQMVAIYLSADIGQALASTKQGGE